MSEPVAEAQMDRAVGDHPAPPRHRPQLPAPQPDPMAYRMNLWLALGSSPRRLLNYLRFRRATRSPRVTYLPTRLDIENVSRCNFRCTMCQVSEWPGQQRAKDMSFEDFTALIDSQYGLIEIKLQGLGEPLLGKCYFAMIRYARSKHIWVRTTTNASLLHLNENYKQLIDSGINEVQISIDGATNETYEEIRRGGRFDRLAQNCRLINAYCDQRRVLRTRMWVVVQRRNLREFLDFADLAHALGFKRLTYSLNLTDFGLEQWHTANAPEEVDDAVTPELAHEAIERGRRQGVEVTFWQFLTKYSVERPESLCAWPFERAYVASDLRVAPCCMIGNPDVFELGNGRAFSQAWNGEAYQEFRRAHLEGRLPQICRGCYKTSGQRGRV